MKKLRIILFVLLLGELVYFLYLETNSIKVVIRDIEDSELAEVMGGVRAVLISDLHIRNMGKRERQLIKLINSIDPDIIFITGDFLKDNRIVRPCIKTLEHFTDCQILAVLGNSDHLSDGGNSASTEFLIRELRRLGINLLMNGAVKLTVSRPESGSNGVVYVVGLDDNYLGYDDFSAAMNNVPAQSPKILLAHSPNIIEKINTDGINLILSGHTHGGQIHVPFIGPFYYNPGCNSIKKYFSGLFTEGALLYVNRGIGTSLIPLRLFCRPEITVLRFI